MTVYFLLLYSGKLPRSMGTQGCKHNVINKGFFRRLIYWVFMSLLLASLYHLPSYREIITRIICPII
jgi:hypothetical protein